MFKRKEAAPKLQKHTLSNGWTLYAHESSALFQRGANEYILMDWEEDVIMKWTTKEDELLITKSSWDLTVSINTQSKTFTVYNEPEADSLGE